VAENSKTTRGTDMKMVTHCVLNRAVQLILLISLLVLSSCASPVQEPSQSPPESAGPVTASGPQPGLSVIYIFQKYKSVDEIPTGKAALRMGRQGAPVAILNHQSGKEESIFASGRSRGVGMVMEGFLDLKEPGTYRWQALANDGIRMFIDDRLIFEDPKVHSDRLTPVGTLQVSEGSRHPVRIIYFQRKGTAALKLYWQPPGAEQFSLVPAEVYWH
jgi:hypothetical protein